MPLKSAGSSWWQPHFYSTGPVRASPWTLGNSPLTSITISYYFLQAFDVDALFLTLLNLQVGSGGGQQVNQLLLVNFQHWVSYFVLDLWVGVFRNRLENKIYCSWDYPQLQLLLDVQSVHCECLTTSSLPVTEKSRVETLKHVLKRFSRYVFENPFLTRILVKYLIFINIFTSSKL